MRVSCSNFFGLMLIIVGMIGGVAYYAWTGEDPLPHPQPRPAHSQADTEGQR